MNNEKLATALSALGITKMALDADQRAAMARATNEPIPSTQGYQGMAGRGRGGIASQVAANDAARAAAAPAAYTAKNPFGVLRNEAAAAPAASSAIQALSRGGGKWGRLAALAAGAVGAGYGGYKLLNAKNPFDSRPMNQRGGRGSATNVDFIPPMGDEKKEPDASSVPIQPSVEGSDLRARMGGQPLPEVAPAAPQGQAFVDSPIKNPAAQFAGTNDRNAVPEQITGQFTGNNGLVAPTSTHFNPVSAEQPFDPNQVSAADKAWFRKDTGTAFNPKSVADVNYFMNRRRNSATMGEADAMEKMRARQNAQDNTATLNRFLGR